MTEKQTAKRHATWRILLNACSTVPAHLRRQFLTYILAGLMDNGEVPIDALHHAMRIAFNAIRRAEENERLRSRQPAVDPAGNDYGIDS